MSAAGKKRIADAGLSVEGAIGFTGWLDDDAAKRKAGLEQMKRDMDLVAQIGEQLRRVERGAQLFEHRLAGGRKIDHAIGRAEQAHRHGRGMIVAGLARDFAHVEADVVARRGMFAIEVMFCLIEQRVRLRARLVG